MNHNIFMKLYSILFIYLLYNNFNAQIYQNQNTPSTLGRVGVNTFYPKSTFDINGLKDIDGISSKTEPTGLQAPRITLKEIVDKGNALYGSDQKGCLLYVTDISGTTGSGQTVNIKETGYYYFDGYVWQKLSGTGSQGQSNSLFNEMKIGDTRATVIVIDNGPNGTFKAGSTSTDKVWMNNRSLSSTQNVGYKLLSEVAPISKFLFFGPNNAFRMDMASGGYVGGYYAPKFVNTSSENMFYSLLADTSYNTNISTTGCWIKPGAVCWMVDGNDGWGSGVNNGGEYATAYILIHNTTTGDASYYQGFWTLMLVDDGKGHNNLYATFSITRLY